MLRRWLRRKTQQSLPGNRLVEIGYVDEARTVPILYATGIPTKGELDEIREWLERVKCDARP